MGDVVVKQAITDKIDEQKDADDDKDKGGSFKVSGFDWALRVGNCWHFNGNNLKVLKCHTDGIWVCCDGANLKSGDKMNLSKFKALVLSCAAAAAFIGCGSSDSGTTAPVTQTGTFVDAPVQGLKYATATQNGFTNDKGEFKFVNGEQVEFSLGNLSFGKVAAQSLVTPYTMAGDTDISNPSTKAQNIAMLLQNLDQNRTNVGVLVINALFANYDFSDVNLSDPALESSMNALLAVPAIAAKIDQNDNSVISAFQATTNMNNYLTENSLQYDKKFTQEYLNGKTFYAIQYWGNDGWQTFETIFGSDGQVTWVDTIDGTFSEPYEITSDGKLKVTPQFGSDPVFYLTIKSVTTDYIEYTADDSTVSEYFYFDKAKADVKFASLQSGSTTTATVSVAGGFSAEWLDGRTIWAVAQDDGTGL
ncbi:MAG: hypothetical protein IBX43_05990 [Campylobacterales bacterium]|nr:hypothetical protein [Campylobacterales bacterium]